MGQIVSKIHIRQRSNKLQTEAEKSESSLPDASSKFVLERKTN